MTSSGVRSGFGPLREADEYPVDDEKTFAQRVLAEDGGLDPILDRYDRQHPPQPVGTVLLL